MNRNDANVEHDPIESVSRTLTEWILLEHLERDPELATRYGEQIPKLLRTEIQTRLACLAQAMQVGHPELFIDSIRWSKIAFNAFGVSTDDVRTSLECTVDVLRSHLPASIGATSAACVEQAISALESMPDELPSPLDASSGLSDLAREFAFQLLGRKRELATSLLLDAFRSGVTFEAICHEVIQPTLAEVGRLWHMNEITVGDEHYCTAAATGIVARLFAEEMERRRPAPNGRTVIVTSVGGDMHELAPRIVANCLELAGWNSVFLGANTPAVCVVDEARDASADVIAISASTSLCIGSVRNAIAAIRAAEGLERVRIIVGGAPFERVKGLWSEIGADAEARSALDAVGICDRLVARRD